MSIEPSDAEAETGANVPAFGNIHASMSLGSSGDGAETDAAAAEVAGERSFGARGSFLLVALDEVDLDDSAGAGLLGLEGDSGVLSPTRVYDPSFARCSAFLSAKKFFRAERPPVARFKTELARRRLPPFGRPEENDPPPNDLGSEAPRGNASQPCLLPNELCPAL